MALIVRKIESLDSNLLNQIGKNSQNKMKNTIATIFQNDDLANIYSILLRDEKKKYFI